MHGKHLEVAKKVGREGMSRLLITNCRKAGKFYAIHMIGEPKRVDLQSLCERDCFVLAETVQRGDKCRSVDFWKETDPSDSTKTLRLY